MEEEKAAAYYDELSRKGEGAARFKQGLGFSSTSSTTENAPARGSALPSSASFLSNFVKASTTKPTEIDKQAQLESIQNKLTKKKEKEKLSPSRKEEEEGNKSRVSRRDDRSSRRQSRSRERDRDRYSRRRSRSRERYRDEERDGGDRRRRRKRSRSRSRSRTDSDWDRRRRRRSRSRSPNRKRRSRSQSPRDRRSENVRGTVGKERNGSIDYSRLIEGYDKMSQAERVKAKMKLQLAETAEKDATKGMGSGWERFEFNKDAPLDDDGDVEAAEDDKALVKHIGQSFRFSAVESKREEQIKTAHDEAMFGASIRAAHDKAMFGTSLIPPSNTTDDEAEAEVETGAETETDKKELNESDLAASLLSEKVLAKQQGSWRDRARRQRD